MSAVLAVEPAEISHPAPHHRNARRLPTGRNVPQAWEHVVSVSGGKDSTALYCLAVERGMPFTAVMADVGHEWSKTIEIAESLSHYTGGPRVQVVRADFTEAFARKRAFILKKWPRDGVPMDRVERAAQILENPTGIPFLDLCMLKGRFPSARARFCTDELKLAPMWYAVQKPILAGGRSLISWQGVRRQESLARSLLPMWSRQVCPAPYCLRKSERDASRAWRSYDYRPLIHWSVEDVFALADRHGIPRHPLYAAGARRVGCWPCMFAGKEELKMWSSVDPGAVDKVEEWEAIVTEVSKRSSLTGAAATFFCASDDPLYEDGAEITTEAFGIRARLEWAHTSRGGRQFDMFAKAEAMSCSAVGVCE